jgi:hypothetical protein
MQTRGGAGWRAVRVDKLSAAVTWVSRITGRLAGRETGVIQVRLAVQPR